MEFLNSEPRCVDTPMHVWVDYSMVPSPRRDFGIHRIVNPNVNGFRTFLFPIPDTVPLVLHSDSCGPTQLSRRDIAYRDSKRQDLPVLETPDSSNLDLDLLTCVLNNERFRTRRDIADRDITILVATTLELQLTKPRSMIYVWIQRPSWS
jgi:hypothetical protein